MLEASVLYAMPRDQGGLTPKELAAKYGVSAHTIHNWIEKVRDATIEARARAPQLAAE
jgi:transposase